MRLKSEHIKALSIIHLIGWKINENNLIKREIITENIINDLMETNQIYKFKNKYGNWLVVEQFNPIINAQDNLTETIVSCLNHK